MPDNQNDILYTAIIYTDGSCLPGIWSYGGGAHGYLYTENSYKPNGDKPPYYIVSDRGYLEKHEISEDDKVVKPEYYYNAVYAYGKNGTNNQAELSAISDTIEILSNEVNLSDIHLLTDSTYTIGVYNLVSKDLDDRKWLLMDRPNLSLWERLADVLVANKDIIISLHKVPAHGTNIGNNTADRLAYAAREMGAKGIVNNKYTLVPGKYWTDKPVPHPFLNFKQSFFNVGIIPDTSEHLYVIMEYPTEIDYGQKSPDPIFGITVFKEPVIELDTVMNTYITHTRGSQYITAIDLKTIYTARYKKAYELLEEHAYNYTKQRYLKLLDEDLICVPITPPGLAQCALTKTLSMYKIYRDYLEYIKSNTDNDNYTDITEQLYDVNDKGKLVYEHPSSDSNISVNIQVSGNSIKLPLVYKKDTMSYNQYRKLVNEHPKVTVVTKLHNEKMFEYYVIIETDKGIGIFGNLYINKVYL